jgi:LuxR family maltose regulon positive regulatory protein
MGRDWDQAGGLIHRAGDAKLRRGELATLLSWCRRMPEQRLLADANWALTYAWTLILVGDLDAGEAVLERAEERVAERSEMPIGELAAAQAFVSRARGDFARTIELSKQALENLPQDNRSARGTVSLNLGLINWHLGQLTQAEAALADAREDTKETENHFGYHTALVFGARSRACRGELSAAADMLEKALGMGDELPTAALAHADLAAIQFERNQLEPAWGHMESARQIARATGNLEFQTACCIQDSLFHLSLGDLPAAEQALRAAPAIGEPEGLPSLSAARLLSCQVQLALASGDVEKARSLHARVPNPHDAHTYFRFIDLNSARIHLAAGDRESAAGELDEAYRKASREGWVYAQHAVRTLQALAEGSLAQAVARILPAIEEAASQRFIRVFLNEGDAIQRVFRAAAGRGIHPTYVGEILAASGDAVGRRKQMGALPEPLTERELEVLSLISAGLSNREIAAQLVVSLGTAKSHIHHIFGKLQVSNRTEAAARGRELGLV